MTSYDYGYARVSTTKQDLTRQLDELRAAGVPEERIYADKKIGGKFEREELAKVLAQLRPGDTLKVSSLDRLGRSLLKMLTLVNELRAEGKHVVTVGPGMRVDTRDEGPATEMAILMLAFLGEVELIFQRERRASTRASLEARGLKPGRPPKVDREGVLADLAAGMRAKDIMAKHRISESYVYYLKNRGVQSSGSSSRVEDRL